jgi:hypothetical protein
MRHRGKLGAGMSATTPITLFDYGLTRVGEQVASSYLNDGSNSAVSIVITVPGQPDRTASYDTGDTGINALRLLTDQGRWQLCWTTTTDNDIHNAYTDNYGRTWTKVI